MTQEKENAGEWWYEPDVQIGYFNVYHGGEYECTVNDEGSAIKICDDLNRLASYDKAVSEGGVEAFIKQYSGAPANKSAHCMTVANVREAIRIATAAQQKRIEELEKGIQKQNLSILNLDADINSFAEWASKSNWVFYKNDTVWWNNSGGFKTTSDLRSGPYAEWKEKQKKGG